MDTPGHGFFAASSGLIGATVNEPRISSGCDPAPIDSWNETVFPSASRCRYLHGLAAGLPAAAGTDSGPVAGWATGIVGNTSNEAIF